MVLLYLGMHHKVKTGIFKALDILPSALGTGLYHYLQRFSENSNLEHKVNSTEKTFAELERICSALNIKLEGQNVIEIGSGWLPLIPYFFRFKAKSGIVHTYDLNAHYQRKSIESLNTIFAQKYGQLVTPSSNSKLALPEGVAYHPSENLIHSTLPNATIVFSRFVLEHVRPEDIKAMHDQFRSLGKEVYVIHFISPSDHRAYTDKSLSLQDFLQYSAKEWNGIQTKFDYHNRLRLPQYLNIFKDSGYEVVYASHESVKPGTAQYDKFKQLNIHPDYAGMTDEELTAGSINVVLKL